MSRETKNGAIAGRKDKSGEVVDRMVPISEARQLGATGLG